MFNEQILEDDDIEAFINAPSPIVVYEKFTQSERPDLLYVEYYRGGASNDYEIIQDPNDPNYLLCPNHLTARVLNPSGAILYANHYHQALYEDENFGMFLEYQVRVKDKYTGLHYGPARRYKTLAMIIVQDVYTIIEVRNGWGRLKEYPNAWILLSATEPITGPGQNPAYDIAGETDQTIAFGDYISISKMTIDRLWCYIDDVQSWVKAEDISFNQAGSLYNALDIQVIELNTLDFNNIESLEDMGIDVQKYRLRYHNSSSFTWDRTYAYSTFSAWHTIKIVYPETIYHYTCIYYKYNVNDINRLGSAAFSCCISDWNPDWDTMIETSWQTEMIKGTGRVMAGNYGQGNTTQIAIKEEPDVNATSLGVATVGDEVLIVGEPVEVETNVWYPIEWDSETVGWIRSERLKVLTPYGGEVEKAPKLYRDTVPTLTWDYFGFDNNLFKPSGFSDGIYLWNPRSWDKDNIKFSFEELIRCGTQRVVYPSFDPDTYKIWVQANFLGGDKYSNMYMSNPGIRINLGKDGQESRIYNAGTNHYDVYASGEFRYNMGGNYPSLRDSLNHTLTNLPNPKYNLMFGNFVVDTMTSFSMEGITMPYEINIRDYNHNLPEIFKNAALGDEIILNWSSYRSTPTAVIGLGNAYEDRAPDYYIGGYDVKLQDNVYLSEDYYYPMPEGWSAYDRAFVDLRWQWLRGVIYSVMSYYDWVLIHYYVPVPKGLWYKYNDEDIRMPENGMFDLMTGQFYPNWHYPTGQSTYYGYEDGHRPNIKDMRDTADVRGATGDGKDFIFLRKQKVSESLAYDYFDDWDFSTHNYSSIKRTVNSGVKAYKKPDLYAIEMNELESGTIVPTSEWTDDAANNVVGTWYRSGGEWIQGTDLETVTGYSVVPVDYTTTLLTGGQYASVPGRKDPKGTVSASYGTGPVVIHGYYEYTNTAGTKFIFDGKYWFSWQQSTRNLIPSDKVFAVATSTTTYSQPIQDAAYAQDRFLPGDRINVIGQVSTGNAWYYCSRGWFWAGTTVSEVL